MERPGPGWGKGLKLSGQVEHPRGGRVSRLPGGLHCRRVAQIAHLDSWEPRLKPVTTLADELGGRQGEGGRRGSASGVEKNHAEDFEGFDLLQLLGAGNRHFRCFGVEHEVRVFLELPGRRSLWCCQ